MRRWEGRWIDRWVRREERDGRLPEALTSGCVVSTKGPTCTH